MRDNEYVKDYFGRLMDVVNQMRLLCKAFADHKVVEKIMVLVPQKFEVKISAIKDLWFAKSHNCRVNQWASCTR